MGPTTIRDSSFRSSPCRRLGSLRLCCRIPSMLHLLGEALVCQQTQLVLPEERQGMQEQHTTAHVDKLKRHVTCSGISLSSSMLAAVVYRLVWPLTIEKVQFCA